MEFNTRFLAISAHIVSWSQGCERHRHSLRQTVSLDTFGWHLDGYVQSVLERSGMSQATAMVTPGSEEAAPSAETAAAGAKDETKTS